jgi:hypothetical protein
MTKHRLTDTSWAALRRATPGFRNWWLDYKRNGYDPTIPYVGIGELARYVALALVIKSRDRELRLLFSSVERLLASGDERLVNLITIGFFESLIHEHEQRYFDLRHLQRLLRGRHSARAWKAALAYVSPEARWDRRRGFVRVVKYRRRQGYILGFDAAFQPTKQTLSVYGLLKSGKVKRGWHVTFRISDYHRAVFRIAAVRQLHTRPWPNLVLLTFKYASEDERQFLSILEDVKYDPHRLEVYVRVPRSAA